MNIQFLKSVILSSAGKRIREEALNILIKNINGNVLLGGIFVSEEVYNKVISFLDCDQKIKAIKCLVDIKHPRIEKADNRIREAKTIIDTFIQERILI